MVRLMKCQNKRAHAHGGRQPRLIVKLARIHELHADAFEAWMEVFGLTQCEHHRPLTDLSWSINDYGFDWRDEAHRAEFILEGWHDDGEFCLPFGYRAVGAAGVFFPW